MPSPRKQQGPVDPKLMTQHRLFMVPPPMPPMGPGGPGGPGMGPKPPHVELRIGSKDIPPQAKSMVIQQMLQKMMQPAPGAM